MQRFQNLAINDLFSSNFNVLMYNARCNALYYVESAVMI